MPVWEWSGPVQANPVHLTSRIGIMIEPILSISLGTPSSSELQEPELRPPLPRDSVTCSIRWASASWFFGRTFFFPICTCIPQTHIIRKTSPEIWLWFVKRHVGTIRRSLSADEALLVNDSVGSGHFLGFRLGWRWTRLGWLWSAMTPQAGSQCLRGHVTRPRQLYVDI